MPKIPEDQLWFEIFKIYYGIIFTKISKAPEYITLYTRILISSFTSTRVFISIHSTVSDMQRNVCVHCTALLYQLAFVTVFLLLPLCLSIWLVWIGELAECSAQIQVPPFLCLSIAHPLSPISYSFLYPISPFLLPCWHIFYHETIRSSISSFYSHHFHQNRFWIFQSKIMGWVHFWLLFSSYHSWFFWIHLFRNN